MNPLLNEGMQQKLILASKSPRRRDILNTLKFDFDVVPAADDVEENVVGRDPFEQCMTNARRKAGTVSKSNPDSLVIGADTLVILGEHAMGKPKDRAEAKSFLGKLSGRTHSVITAVVLSGWTAGAEICGFTETRVRFRKLDNDEVDNYIATGECDDKAGAYAAQGLGAALVQSIDGCFFNVVGLPVPLLFTLLKRF